MCFSDHICHTKISTRFGRLRVLRLGARKSHSSELQPEEYVRVWHRNREHCREFRMALIDTGSHENFIRRSLVEERELEIRRVPPVRLTPFGPPFEVSEAVRPTWQFYGDPKLHQDYDFLVVPEIPGDRDMLLGNIARGELGITLQRSWPALPVHEDHEGMF